MVDFEQEGLQVDLELGLACNGNAGKYDRSVGHTVDHEHSSSGIVLIRNDPIKGDSTDVGAQRKPSEQSSQATDPLKCSAAALRWCKRPWRPQACKHDASSTRLCHGLMYNEAALSGVHDFSVEMFRAHISTKSTRLSTRGRSLPLRMLLTFHLNEPLGILLK